MTARLYRCTYRAADAAVDLGRSTAATVTLIVHRHLQAVFEAHRLDGEGVVGAAGRAAPGLHAHVEGHLQRTRGRNHGASASHHTEHASKGHDVGRQLPVCGLRWVQGEVR